MKLRDWDWDGQKYVETDYPDAPVIQFMDWLRTTKAWHADPEAVHRQLRKVNQAFADFRQAKVEAAVATAKNMKNAAQEARAERNRANLAKARAVKAEKVRLAKIAEMLAPQGELPRDF